MAAAISSRLLRRSLGFLKSNRLSNFSGLYSRPLVESTVATESSSKKACRFLLGCRSLTTSVMSPESKDAPFPPELLSKKEAAEEREIGLMEDLLIPVTNFHNEDKGFTVLIYQVEIYQL
uniref:Uncharacterized protein n=1 Tax=Kalanchoe fedtschenkoi TaxID=63787 RepID=A0A7N0SXL9_KALFE